MAKINKVPVGTSKHRAVPNHGFIVERKKHKPAKTNFKKPMALKHKAAAGTYENPPATYQRSSNV